MTGIGGAQGSFKTQGADGDKALFVDGGVYTRNRAFRLFLSSKAGKDAVLQLTGLPPAMAFPICTDPLKVVFACHQQHQSK